MIRLLGLYPEHLNLNGDFGNLDVLAKQLEWRGLQCEVSFARAAESIGADVHFVLIGHGSAAAWADIAENLTAQTPILRRLIDRGVPVMGVSTGYEHLVGQGLLAGLTAVAQGERVSKFEIVQDGSNQVLGYLNSDKPLPALVKSGAAIGTLLHGPILAKNPGLLEEVLAAICRSAGLELAPIRSNEKASQLADLVERVWELERELSNE